MSTERKPGMDHGHYPWSPIGSRPAFRWSSGAPVALAVIVLVEHVEFPPPTGFPAVTLLGGVAGSMFPSPNLTFYSQREYGHRIGVFRILDSLERLGVPPTIAIDAAAAERYPLVIDDAKNRRAEFVAHGLSASRVVSSALNPDAEASYIAAARDRIATAVGETPAGWMGPEQSESERTPTLLDEAGFDYVCDWPNDEQPYLMDTPHGLVSVPTCHLLDDGVMVAGRARPPKKYSDGVTRAFARMSRDAVHSSRALVLVLRPWLSGQPFRIDAMEHALQEILAAGEVWPTTTGAIAADFRRHAQLETPAG